MHAKIAYIILGALSALTSATPVDTVAPAEATGSVAPVPVGPTPDPVSNVTATEIGPNARAGPTVKVCTNAGFSGRCATFGSTNRICYILPSAYNDVVSAFGPSQGQTCTIYQDTNCKGNSRSGIRFPGISDLRAVDFNDRMTSYLCFN
ncbi:MAG: hypothetical protein L6R38_001237 [Xanthoria sp. 2 TBL-2021]|nr:MAG: hypothetical protein L6R38_001237 [Xanthoria sp. 2 TBL-2021]